MARKGHYSYERRQRDLAKAAKREAKREARAAKRQGASEDTDEPNDEGPVETHAAAVESSGGDGSSLAPEREP